MTTDTHEKMSAEELTHARQVVTAIAPWVETSELGELRRAAYILLRHLDALEAERAPVAFANDAKERGKQMASHIAMIEKRGGPAPDWIDICAEVSTRISAVAYMACEKTSLARIAEGRADYDAAVRNVEDLRRRFAELTGPPCDRGTLGQELRALLCRNSPTPWSELASELQEEYRTAAAHLRARGAASRQEEVDALRSSIASRDDTIARLNELISKPGFDFLTATDEARAAGAASRDGEVAGLTRELAASRDCGQAEVCATPPGCARHWEKRNRELAAQIERLTAELANARAGSEPLPRHATLPPMPTPTLVQFTAAAYRAFRPAGSPAWDALLPGERETKLSHHRWCLDYIANANGLRPEDIYAAGPTDPPPTQPPT